MGKLTSRRFQVSASGNELMEFFEKQGWSDGLPIQPPTPDEVERFLKFTQRDPADVLGIIPPLMGKATLEKVAINAVMAGCRPDYAPVIVAAVEALCDEAVNLTGAQATTHPCGIFVLLNGPMAKRLDVNCQAGAFGPGWRANATIGRAVRLILINLGGATPGLVDKSTQGQPCKFTFCAAENEARNPWQPYHVELGFPPGTSTVTVFPAEGPHNISDHSSKTALGVARTIAQSMSVLGSNNAHFQYSETFVCLAPEHATMFHQEGWTKKDIQQFIHLNAGFEYKTWRQGGNFGLRQSPKWLDGAEDDTFVPIVDDPANCHVIVIGGDGRHSSWIPSHGTNGSATRAILDRNGAPLK